MVQHIHPQHWRPITSYFVGTLETRLTVNSSVTNASCNEQTMGESPHPISRDANTTNSQGWPLWQLEGCLSIVFSNWSKGRICSDPIIQVYETRDFNKIPEGPKSQLAISKFLSDNLQFDQIYKASSTSNYNCTDTFNP